MQPTQPSHPLLVAGGVWLSQRALTSLAAASAAYLTGRLPAPSAPLNAWLGQALLQPWLRWDAHWYVQIIERGYSSVPGAAQFHPLFPGLAALLVGLGFSPLLAMMALSGAAALAFFLLYLRLAASQLEPADQAPALILLAFYPVTFILFAPYTESLFMALSALCLLAVRQQRWLLAACAGALAALTRQQGLFLLAPLGIALWQAQPLLAFKPHLHIPRPAWQTANLAGWLSAGIIPAAYLGWLVYRATLSDVQPDFSSFNGFLYTVLISPQAVHVVPEQAFLPPWQALYLAVEQFARAPDVDLATNLILGGLFVGLLAAAWPRLDWPSRAYCLLNTLVSFSYYTGPVHPYMGLARHLYLSFPVFIALAPLLRQPWQRLTWASLGLAGSFFLSALYTLEGWVP